jgi:hypothetical protein
VTGNPEVNPANCLRISRGFAKFLQPDGQAGAITANPVLWEELKSRPVCAPLNFRDVQHPATETDEGREFGI